jgi:hypothetical protein
MSDLDTDPALEGPRGVLELCRNLDYWTAMNAIIRVRFPTQPDALFLAGKDFEATDDLQDGVSENYRIEGDGGRILDVFAPTSDHASEVRYMDSDAVQGFEAIEVYKGVDTDG